MNANQIIADTLRKMALTLEMDGEGEDRSLSEAIPLPLANELAGRLRGHGFTVSVSTDNDDREMAWVYVAEPSKARVLRWETAATYTSQVSGGDGSCTVEVQIGQDSGAWFLRTTDDAGGSDDCDDTDYETREAAESAAKAFAVKNDDPDDVPPTPDPSGEWCCHWTSALDDAGPRARYATQEQAAAAEKIANAQLQDANPGSTLLCGFEARQLVDGVWVAVDDE